MLFWKFQTLNELLHIPRIIPVKFHYNLIKKISFEHSREWRSFWKFSYRNVHLHISRIIPVKFHHNRINFFFFLNFHGYHGNRPFWKCLNLNGHLGHPKDHFCDRPKKKKFPEEKKIPHRIDSIVNPPTI